MTVDDRIAQPPPVMQPIVTDHWTAPFWAAAARHELVVPRCGQCGRFRMPPTPFCPHCRSQIIDWSFSPTVAELYSYTIVERAIFPAMEQHLPYVPAIAAFPEAGGARLITNIVDTPIRALVIGARLSLRWIDREPGVSLPVFTVLS